MLGSSASPACPCGLVWLKQRSIWTLKHQNRLQLWCKKKSKSVQKMSGSLWCCCCFSLGSMAALYCSFYTHKSLTFAGAASPASSSELTWLKQGSVSQCGSWGIAVLRYTDMCKREVTIFDVILILNPKACCPQVHLPHYGPAGGGSAPCCWPLRVRQEYLVYSFANAAGRCSVLVRVCFDNFRSSGDFKK